MEVDKQNSAGAAPSNAARAAGVNVQEAIAKLEELYTKKEAEVKDAQEEYNRAHSKLVQCEREAHAILRQLTPLQNRYLLNIIDSQTKKMNELGIAAASRD